MEIWAGQPKSHLLVFPLLKKKIKWKQKLEGFCIYKVPALALIKNCDEWIRAFRDKARPRPFGWSSFLAVGHRIRFWLSSGQRILGSHRIKRNWETAETRADPEQDPAPPGPITRIWLGPYCWVGTQLLSGVLSLCQGRIMYLVPPGSWDGWTLMMFPLDCI